MKYHRYACLLLSNDFLLSVENYWLGFIFSNIQCTVSAFCFSGDTRPCAELIKAGRNADVLIHEATFDDSLEEDAKRKMHSTSGEAIGVGRDMGARFTLLTHFSSRLDPGK